MSNTKPIKKRSTIFPYRGKWRIQYFDLDGKVRTKTVATKQDAYKDLVILEQLVASGALPKRSQDVPMFSDWLLDWVDSRRNEVRPVTLWGFESTTRLHLLPSLGHLRLNQISTLTIEHLYNRLIAEKNLSRGSIQKIHSILSHSLEKACRHGFIDSNPAQYVKLPKSQSPKIHVFGLEEIAKLLQVAAQFGPLAEFRWLLALRYGLRQGECLALEWCDLDDSNRTITISRTVNSIPGQGFVVTPPKSDQSRRVIPLDDYTYNLTRVIRTNLPKANPNSLIFTSGSGSYIDARTDYDRWQKLLKTAGLAPVKLHSARHAAATLLLSSGANIRSIQLLLGHSSPSFTMATYLHPSQESLRLAIEQVSQITTRSSPCVKGDLYVY
jgi:integrase